MTKRKTFSKEFKLEAVMLLEQGDRSPNEIAISLGIRRNQLYKWQTQLKAHGNKLFVVQAASQQTKVMSLPGFEKNWLKLSKSVAY